MSKEKRGQSKPNNTFLRFLAKFYARFRPRTIFRGIARWQRRRAAHEERVFTRNFRSTQYSRDLNRHRAKIKARNRRNRKQTRALHRLERSRLR